jgi:FHS family L-fucose permease-like MFS transporter
LLDTQQSVGREREKERKKERKKERQLMARSRYTVSLVFLTFFVISLLNNILGPIVPDIITSFRASVTAAGFLAFAFFIAYGVMSIPAGFLVERFTEKPVTVLAFLAGTLGSLSFASQEGVC